VDTMSRLALYGRPYVIFDASNRDHRKWFAEFNKTGAWGSCPVRFVVYDDHGDLITMIQRHLIQYYVDKEFTAARTVAKKQQKKMQILVDD
jgi:hypothetical protein